MVLPGHLAGGYLTALAVLEIAHTALPTPLTPHEATALLIFGTLAADLPDLDLFWFSFKHRVLGSQTDDNHRNYVSHAPIIWLAIALIVVGIGALAGSTFTELIGWLILSGSWTHFLLDSIEFGVMWLWPFSHKRFCLRRVEEVDTGVPLGSFAHYWRQITRVYPTRITFWCELTVTLAALVVAFLR